MLYEVLHFMAEREKYGSLNLGLDNSSQIKRQGKAKEGYSPEFGGQVAETQGRCDEILH